MLQLMNSAGFEILLSWGYQLAVLVWLCVLTLLSLTLAAFFFHFCRRHRYLVARGEVVGLATQSTLASPSSADQQQQYQLTSAGNHLFSFHVIFFVLALRLSRLS